MPRKKSNDGAGLGKPIAFRLSDADRAVYLEKVNRSGLTQSEFFRQAVLTNRTQVIARPVASVDRKRLLYIFNKTSNNLNQIAHRLHSLAQANIVDAQRYLAVLDALASIESALTDALAHARPH